MPLGPGSRLDAYEIVRPLGTGGMGEVWLATELRLGRKIALKILPADLTRDATRVHRFEQEARAASALNHPNVCHIYALGETTDGQHYIAMEYVEGETLRQRLSTTQLPIREALDIAIQVAAALSAAHAAGIIHRDIKPENVMLRPDGFVKVLDFGLAKLAPTAPEAGPDTTRTALKTDAGIVVGTAAYMSPEQAQGKPVDFRSDQFSFGVILYELATGQRAFARGSVPQTLTAIIQDEPEPIAALNPRVPAPLRWIIDRCLGKEARNRFESTEDLARDLATIRDHLSEATSGVGFIPELTTRTRRRLWIPVVMTACILAALGVTAWRLRSADYFWKNPLAGARYTRFTDWEGSELDAAISPDGKFVAFLSDRDGRFDVWVGQVGGGQFLNLSKGQYPNLTPAVTLVRELGFSDDGAHVGFSLTGANGQAESLWIVPTMGGPVRPFLSNALEATWSATGGQVLYHTVTDPGDPIFIADRNGRNRKQIFSGKPGIHNHYPTWSPDGRFIYFVHGIPPKDMDVWRLPSTGGVAERLTRHHSQVTYPTLLDERTLIYIAPREDSGFGLYAMDVERAIPHVISSGLEEYLSVAAGADGRRLVATVANPAQSLWKAPISDRITDDASLTRFSVPTGRAASPRFGSDYVLYLSSKGGATGLWKFKDGSETELWKGSDGVATTAPAISPDGSQIAFVVGTAGAARLYLMAADGTSAHRIAESLNVSDAPSWSPDGTWIAVAASDGKTSPLFKVPADGGPPVRLVEGVNYNPVWSPDGRFILYSEAHGGPVLRLRGVTPDRQPFAIPEVRVLYAGNRYRFLPDGKALVVMLGDGVNSQNFWLLDLATGHMRQLTNLRPGSLVRSFDISPDGKQILFDRDRENADIVLIDRGDQ
jgi:Tol biopolymer transport system component